MYFTFVFLFPCYSGLEASHSTGMKSIHQTTPWSELMPSHDWCILTCLIPVESSLLVSTSTSRSPMHRNSSLFIPRVRLSSLQISIRSTFGGGCAKFTRRDRKYALNRITTKAIETRYTCPQDLHDLGQPRRGPFHQCELWDCWLLTALILSGQGYFRHSIGQWESFVRLDPWLAFLPIDCRTGLFHFGSSTQYFQ